MPVAAQLASLPIVIYHFNLLSFWAPLVNIIIVPLVGILVPLLFLALSISLVAVKLAEPFCFWVAVLFTVCFSSLNL